MHVAIIGATGRVAKVAIQNLFLSNRDRDLRVTLAGHDKEHVDGFCRDIVSAFPLMRLAGETVTAPHWHATDDLADIRGADLVVIAAATLPTPEEKAAYKKIDPTGRLGLSFANLEMIKDVSQSIAKYAPDAWVLMVTNQSDAMAEVARKYLNPDKVLGLGGMIDSARFRHLVSETPGLLPETGHIIGYHTDDMIPLSSSMANSNVSDDFLSNCLAATRAYGGIVSTKMKPKQGPVSAANTGATIAPGLAIAQIVRSFTGQAPSFEEAFNIHLSDPALANSCNLPLGSSLSLPVIVLPNKFKPSHPYHLTQQEQAHIADAAGRMNAGVAALLAAKQPNTAKRSNTAAAP